MNQSPEDFDISATKPSKSFSLNRLTAQVVERPFVFGVLFEVDANFVAIGIGVVGDTFTLFAIWFHNLEN